MKDSGKLEREVEARVDAYFRAVLDGSAGAGKLERQAVERHLRDLRDGSTRGLRFSWARAFHAVEFVEGYIRHTKGEWAGRRIHLEGWQLFTVVALFGWERETPEGWFRRFRSAYISMARKNGKTMLAAAIAAYMLVGDCEPGAEVYFAATKREQAKIGWQQTARCIQSDPELRRFATVHESNYNISVAETDSKCEAVSADHNTLDGLNAHCGVVDELHAHPNRGVYDVIESSMGARREPLLVGITTAGDKRHGLCWDLDHDGVRILDPKSEIQDDSMFVLICRLDDGDDIHDETVWRKSNPNLGISVKLQMLRDASRKAKNNFAAVSEYKRKHCNLWTEAVTAWLPLPVWDACLDQTLDLLAFAGEPCVMAADLSSTSDFTALVLLFRRPDGTAAMFPFFWIPEETIPERVRTDRVPVDEWVAEKLIEATPGNVVDQDAMKLKILQFAQSFDVREIAMDPHNAAKLQTELLDLGLPVVSFQQGWKSMTPAIQQAEFWIQPGKLRHDGNPVMRWMMSNVALHIGPTETKKFDKARSQDRIDGVVAMVMAIGRAVTLPEPPAPMISSWGA